MPIIDFTNVEKVYRGSVEMKKVYEGQSVVWEKPIDYFYIQNEHAGSNILTLTKTGSALTTASDLEYSLDETNWTSFDLTQASSMVTIPQGGKVYMRSTTGFTTNTNNYLSITTSEDCSAGGDVMSLIDYTNIGSVPLQAHCLRNLFYGNTKLINASGLQLPRTTLVSSCYRSMFQGCTSLTQAPALPATTLAYGCYYSMFQGCTSLTQAPALPATTLAMSCYQSMFYNCISLTQAPVLPATTLAMSCYQGMFQGCTSLTQAPELPATTLATVCYAQMFQGCASLTQAPELPATTLLTSCYSQMFYNCTSLNYIKCLAEDISATSCTSSWVNGVAATGTFVKYSHTPWTTGVNGVPSGWTVNNIVKYFRITNEYDGSNTISLVKNSYMGDPNNITIMYSKNDGDTWSTWSSSNSTQLNVSLTSGQSVIFKANGNNPAFATNSYKHYYFTGTQNFSVSGNIMTLLSDTGSTAALNNKSYALGGLFAKYNSNVSDQNPTLISAKNLILPALTLSYCCYNYMFQGCVGLLDAPKLPATTLSGYCYATMFKGCTSLAQAPELPATTLVEGCYEQMFSGCSHLNYIKCLATNPSLSYLTNWVYSVAATGTFVKDANTTWSSGIPSGWTIQNA